jgi:hypothetical protein
LSALCEPSQNGWLRDSPHAQIQRVSPPISTFSGEVAVRFTSRAMVISFYWKQTAIRKLRKSGSVPD